MAETEEKESSCSSLPTKPAGSTGRCNTSTLWIGGGVYVATPGPAGLSVEQRTETWRRWKAGYGVREIG